MRPFDPSTYLQEVLKPFLTVYTYDRRGRGASGDTRPYAPEREYEETCEKLRSVAPHLVPADR